MIEREEFELRLKATFNWKNFCIDDPLTCILTDDTEKLDAMRTCMTSCATKVSGYLSQWDAAQTDEEKMVIVGSVQGTLE